MRLRNKNSKSTYDKRIERLERENETLKEKNNLLKIENKRLSNECERLYDSFDDIAQLEVQHKTAIDRAKEVQSQYRDELKKITALKSDYIKTMEKYLRSLK